MRILFLGDIYGRSGREAVARHLPALKDKLIPDVVIVNGENAAHGTGITDKICRELYELGVDCITTGNHVWDQRDIIRYIDDDPRLLRPGNYPKGTPGRGAYLHTAANGERILIANMMARLFMDPLDDPFAAMKSLTDEYRLGRDTDVILLDFHGEATSEKLAMAFMLDGKISAMVGTHTHIPTADARILPEGTAYQTDAGMCGDYDSVIGVRKETPIARFTRKMPTERLGPADGEGTVCGVLIETDEKTGLAKQIASVVCGPHLPNRMPAF